MREIGKIKNSMNDKAITLIALVVTIVVLLILAAVSISMLTGENGIINQASKSKTNTDIGMEKDFINLAMSAIKTNKLSKGDDSAVTSDELQKEINKYTKDATVTGTGILTVEYNSGRKYEVDGNGSILEYGESYDGMYSVPGLEGKIAPTEIFEYELVSNSESASIELSELPVKKAKITGIKGIYCNSLEGGVYNPETGEYVNTHYEIKYDNKTISDTLVVPYQVEGKYVKDPDTGTYGNENEFYTITEAQINCVCGSDGWRGVSLPKIKTIIFPNTITKIVGKGGSNAYNPTLERVVLPNKLVEIGDECFSSTKIANITIPDTVTYIGKYAFAGCTNLTNIIIPDSVTNIEIGILSECNSLTNVTIPNGVTNIGKYAFGYCRNLTSIKLPTSVSSISEDAFYGCDNLKTIIIKRNPGDTTKISGEPWGATNANVMYIEIDAEYEEFAINYVADKSQEELEELLLKSMLYTGTFEELLSEEDMTKTDLEQQASKDGMSYIEFLKFSLIYQKVGTIPWTLVEYETWLQGGSGKTVEELENLFVQKNGDTGTFDDLLAQEGITREQFEEEIKNMGFRSEEDFLKYVIYI